MSNNKYFIRVGGLNEFALNTNSEEDGGLKNPFDLGDTNNVKPPSDKNNPLENPQDIKAKTPNVIGVASKAEPLSPPTPSKSALGGYEPVTNEKSNSEVIDKTPENSELNDPSQLKNDEPSTSEDEHPHQIQGGEVEREHELEKNTDTVQSPEIENGDEDVVSIEVDETNKSECQDCGCGKVNTQHDKIKKLQALHERYSKKPFLTMKEVMLLNEARKIINNAKR